MIGVDFMLFFIILVGLVLFFSLIAFFCTCIEKIRELKVGDSNDSDNSIIDGI